MKKVITLFLISFCLFGCSLKSDVITPPDKNGENGPSKAELATQVINYVRGAVYKVNEAGRLKFYDSTVLYMIPVGNDPSKSCIEMEENDPNSWKYLYIGVVYTGTGYEYYAIGETEKGRGFELVSQGDLKIKSEEVIYEVSGDSTFKDSMISNYNSTVNISRPLNSQETDAYQEVLSKHKKIKTVVYIAGGKDCSYS